jgi:hypothetical protein
MWKEKRLASNDVEPRLAPDVFVVAPWSQPLACHSELVQAPTIELFTIEEAKLRAGLSWLPGDPRDALMQDHILAAQQKVEQDTGLALTTQVRDVYFEVPTDGMVPLPSQCTPVQTIEERTVPVGTGHIVRRRLAVGSQALVTAGYCGIVRVTAGWTSKETFKNEVPLLYQAVGLMIAHFATLGRDLAITGAVASVNVIPEGYEAAIQPYRLVWVV